MHAWTVPLDFILSKVPMQLAHSFGTKEYHRKGREVHHHQLCPPLRSDVDIPSGKLRRIYQNSRYCVDGVSLSGPSPLFYPMPLQLLQCQCSLRVFGDISRRIWSSWMSYHLYIIFSQGHPYRHSIRNSPLLPPSGRLWLQEDGSFSPPKSVDETNGEIVALMWLLYLHGTDVEAFTGGVNLPGVCCGLIRSSKKNSF